MKSVYVDAVGLSAPGMADWDAAADVLVGRRAYVPTEIPAIRPTLLPPNERRRVSATVRLALKVAEEVVSRSSLEMGDFCSVFATCDADTETIDRICRALTLPERPVSPTQFHNSVHNAAAGYWAIAAHSPLPSTTVSAYGGSFAAGLMEAAAQLLVEQRPVLLVAYDHTAPAPLAACIGDYPPFAVAMALSPVPTPGSTAMTIDTVIGEPPARMGDGALERLRRENPAAAALPLLRALASCGPARVVLPHVNGLQLALDVGAE